MTRTALLGALLLAGCPDPATPLQPRFDSQVGDMQILDMAVIDARVDMQPGDAAHIDAAPIDMGAPDAAPPPDPCETADDLVDIATALGDGFVYDDITRDDDGGHGTCGGYGADRVLRFTAPTAGIWRAHVTAEIPGYEPVIHARAVCADPATELACRDQIAEAPGAAIHLHLEADETVFLFVDADNTRGGFFRLAVEPISEAVDVCDVSGLTDACPAGQECRLGLCAPTSIPQLDAVDIWRQPSGRYGMVFNGSDAGADTVAFLLTPIGRSVPDVAPSRLNVDLRDRQTWSIGLRVNTPSYFAAAHRMRIAAIDALDQRSDWLEVPIRPSALADLGEKCSTVFEPCTGSYLCQGGVCVEPNRPTLFDATAILNPDDPAIAVRATANRAAQVREIEVELLDAEGSRVERFTARVSTGPRSDTRSALYFSRRLDLDPPVAATTARLTPIGAAGWEGTPVEIALDFAAQRAEGEACDPDRALDHCPADTTCFDRVCTPITTECPADWNPLPLEGDGPWRFIGRLGDETLATRPSCGGGAHAIAHVFDAPADGEYLITAYSGELRGDPVLAIRSHCGYDGRSHPEFELACNDDALRLNARLVVSLTAGQRIYPIVDGHGDWRGTYILLIDRR